MFHYITQEADTAKGLRPYAVNQPIQFPENLTTRIESLFPEGIDGCPGVSFSIQDVAYGSGPYSYLWRNAVTQTYQDYGWIGPDQEVDFENGDRGLLLFLHQDFYPQAAVGGVRALYGNLETQRQTGEIAFTHPLFVSNFDLSTLRNYHEVVPNDVRVPDGVEMLAPALMHEFLSELAGQRQFQFAELAKLFHATRQVLEWLGKNPNIHNERAMVRAMRDARAVVLSTLGAAFNDNHIVAYVRGHDAAKMFVELNKGRQVYATPLPAEAISLAVRDLMPGYFWVPDQTTPEGRKPKDVTLLISPRRDH